MTERTDFQAKCLAEFSTVLEAWGLNNSGENICKITNLELIAQKLSELGSSAGKGTIIDFGDKHFDNFKNAYAREDLLFVSWKENEENFFCEGKGSCLLRCKPECMILYRASDNPPTNCIYIRTNQLPVPEKTVIDKEGVAQCVFHAKEKPYNFNFGGEYIDLTTLTRPIPVLIHPKGSVYVDHKVKRKMKES